MTVTKGPGAELGDRRSALLPQTATLVKDIYPGTAPSSLYPWGIVAAGTSLFFVLDEPATGQELWKTDGTPGGTSRVKDIWPGGTGSFPSSLTNMGGTLYFSARDPIHGGELWKSDGTEAGTVLVKDAWPGANGTYPQNLTNVNGTLFFAAYDSTNGQELWKSDGTAAGTVLVKDIYPGSTSGNALSSSPSNLTNVNGTLFFTADDGVSGGELWKSNGTAAGTVLVKDIVAGSGSPSPADFVAANGTLFFTADDGVHGRELWKSDGTAAGTVLLKDILPGTSSSYVGSLTNVNGMVFFSAMDVTYGAGYGNELWKSDGTAAGTVLVKDIYPGNTYDPYFGTYANSSNPYNLINVNGTLFFSAWDGSPGTLWKSNGTAAGTVKVGNVYAGSGNMYGSNPWVNVNGTLYFNGFNSTAGYELWKSDGTAGGTVMVMDLLPGTNSADPRSFTFFDNKAFFIANDGAFKLWKSDGTVAGTTTVGGFPTLALSSSPNGAVELGQNLLFAATNALGGRELWMTDGTDAGTVLVKDINPGASSSSPYNLARFNDAVYFAAVGATGGLELWKSDGTSTGTVLVKDINAAGHSYPGNFANAGGTLFFTADDGVTGQELWTTDGTDAGTMLVKDIAVGATGSSPGSLVAIGSTLFFAADDGATGVELWKSDGTDAGTVLVKDIAAGATASWPWGLTPVGTTLFFTALDPASGQELWKSDGTASGTVLVKDIRPGGHSSPQGLINFNGTLYFSADDGVNGRELWKSDGTQAGTVLVKDLCPGPDGSSPERFVSLGGALFFLANGGTVGPQLWKSDGTAAGTIALGLAASAPIVALPAPFGQVVFAGYDPLNGVELWASDGTVAGTRLAADVVPGLLSSNPVILGLAGSNLVFTANTAAYGAEPWALPLSAFDLTPPVVTPSVTGTLGPGGWYLSDVAVSFATSDTLSPVSTGAGCQAVTFSTDSAGTTLTCTATSSGGSTSASVTIKRDATPPSLVCPSNVAAEAASAGGATVAFAAATATDTMTATPVIGYSRDSGTPFPMGATSVVVTATDEAGNGSTCSFLVTVADGTAPTVTCGASVVVEATSDDGAVATYALATASDAVDPAPALAYSHSSGALFPLGKTTVTATATDSSGNAGTCGFDVTVQDTGAPVVTCPASVMAEATSATGAITSYVPASATDAIDAAPALNYSQASGTLFPLGITAVVATATDSSGNTATCSFDVSVVDTTAPVIACPADAVVEAAGATGGVANYTPATASDAVTGTPTVTHSKDSGTLFPLGATSVTATATDGAGNKATCAFTVTVVDTTKPTLTCPHSVVVGADDASGATVNYAAIAASDGVDPVPAVTYSRPSGARFDLGDTPVTATATDASGNAASCTWTISVSADVPSGVSCPAVDANADGKPDPCPGGARDSGVEPSADGGVAVSAPGQASGCGCGATDPTLLSWLALVLGAHVSQRRRRR